MSDAEIAVAVDNDIVLKAISYGLVADLWPALERIGVLGAARYVLSDAIKREGHPAADEAALLEALSALVGSVSVLEPTASELELAADLELAAQQQALDLDTGETQLAAIVVERAVAALETGDKRAIRALEVLLRQEPRLAALAGKVRCLEQIILRVLAEGTYDQLRGAICDRPDADKTLSICFACSSDRAVAESSAVDGLSSYIAELRSDAPTVLSH